MDLYLKSGEKTTCLLCPHLCRISDGQTGLCRARRNSGGEIVPDNYGIISGLAADPVEKKPLYHFFPGSVILSAGSYGCNMRCDFCQNYSISQTAPVRAEDRTTPSQLVDKALALANNLGIAFTYNEPVIWFEFMRDTAILARKAGMQNIMVSNGYVNDEPLSEIISFIDAFNIDLKGFSESFYKKLTGASMGPVLNTLKRISAAGRHLEITTLIIPGINDSVSEMARQAEWISGELGNDVPLHLSRYFPAWKRNDPSTPKVTLEVLASAASQYLDYVYLGNSGPDGQDTNCPACGIIITRRSGYRISHINLDDKGKCKGCGSIIYRNFSPTLPTVR